MTGNDRAIVALPSEFVDRARGTSKICYPIIAEALALVTWWGVRARVARRLHHPFEMQLPLHTGSSAARP